jgi:hypothetical protein
MVDLTLSFGFARPLRGHENSVLFLWMIDIRHWAPVSANTMSSADCWRGPGLTWVAFVFDAAFSFLSLLLPRRAFSFLFLFEMMALMRNGGKKERI